MREGLGGDAIPRRVAGVPVQLPGPLELGLAPAGEDLPRARAEMLLQGAREAANVEESAVQIEGNQVESGHPPIGATSGRPCQPRAVALRCRNATHRNPAKLL